MKKVIATTDILVKYTLGTHYRLLLIKRKYTPFKGFWALPGGHIDVTDKNIVTCAQRELKEETNLTVPLTDLKYMYTVGNNYRDPRGFALTNVFRVDLDTIPENIKAQDDASDLKWFNINTLPTDIAFDHKQIIDECFHIIT